MKAPSLNILRGRVRLITFDCYGTLVDWETGIRSAIRQAANRDDAEIFDAYLVEEARVEADGYRSYRDVCARALQSVAHRFDFDVPSSHRTIITDTLPEWPVWPDTRDALRRLKTRFQIGVLSNIDRDLFAATAKLLDVGIDLLVTAQDVQSYKPAHAHFLRMLELHIDRESVLHAAQSWFHDCVPATQLGLPNVWINRRGESPNHDANPMAVFADLTEFADAMGV